MSRRILRVQAVLALLAITLSTACVVEGVIDVDKLTGDALNPEAHRGDITAIDAILFEDGGLTADGRAELVKRLMSLSEVAATDPSNTIALNIGKNMTRFAAGVERTPLGTPLLNSPMRRQWMAMRSSLFADAAWWRWSSADPIER